MTDNSPMKNTRAYHPYGRIKSPLRPSQQTVQPPSTGSLASKMTSSYFSFSGGSSSLFPKTATTRSALSTVSGVENVLKPRPFSTSNTTGRSGAGTAPKISGVFSSLWRTNQESLLAQKKGTGGERVVTKVGPIGGRLPLVPTTSGQPIRGSGFIPVQRSFKIWGDSDSNSNSMEFADVESNAKSKELKITEATNGATEGLHRSKSVRKNLFQQSFQVDHTEETRSKGILSEHKNAVYDYPEYTCDIYNYFLGYESRSRIKTHYMSRQEDVTHGMRSILVDWMVEVGVEFGFEDGTIFMAVGYVDRFLSKMAVKRNKLQLVGTAAVYIASKCQVTDCPGITEVVEITDQTYTKEQILIMEGIMLRTLDFELLVPTTSDFLCCLGSLMALDSQVVSLALYLAELSMVDGARFLKYPPSVVATAAIATSRYTHENIFWDARLELLSRVKYPDIRPVSADLLVVFYDAPTNDLTAVYHKYKSLRYNCVSYSILKPTLPPIEHSSVSFSI